MGAILWISSNTPTELPFIPLHEPLHWKDKRDPKAKNAFSAVLSTEGRAVGLCWGKLKPQEPKQARATGPGVRVVKNRGSRRNGAALSPEMGVFAPPSPFFKNV